MLVPTHPSRLAVYAYLLLIVLAIASSSSRAGGASRRARPTLYLTAFVWENLLIQQPAVTRSVLFGALLIGADGDPPAGPVRDGEGGDRLMAAMLELNGVSKAFGGLQVISSLDFHVDEREIVSVIGPNGAGKTTLFNLVTGVYEPDEGEILLRGRVDRRAPAAPDHAARHRAHLPDAAAVPEHDREGERDGGRVLPHEAPAFELDPPHAGDAARGARDQALAEEKLAFFGQRLMGYRWNQPAYSLSYANRRRLEIARATATNARLLLLDEPAAGMNPVETHEITELIGKLRDEGGYTILVIEHDMHVVEGISDRVVALDHGVKIAEGSFDAGRDRRARGRGLPRACARAATK